MKELNSAQMGVTSGSICRLPRPVPFPSGRGCARMRAEATVTLKNNNAGAQNLTGATAKWILATLFDTSTLRFGDRKPEIVDSSLAYARARELMDVLTMDDFIIQASGYNSGAPKRVRDVADADVIAATVAAGATTSITVEFTRAFEVTRLGVDAYSYCPGASQMRQIQWEFVRGGAVDPSGNFTQNGAADVLFIADDYEAHDDQWAFVPRLYQQEEAGRESHGPRGPIGLLAMWDYNAVGASTPLTLFTIKRDGDAPLHDNVNAKRVVRDALYTDPIGAYDVNALATVLFNLPGDADKHDTPVGSGFTLVQTGSELNPPKTAWLHVPVYDQSQVDALVGENVRDALGVKLISAAAKSGKGLGSGAASLEPVIIAHKDSADFEALPGRVIADGVAPSTHIPAAVMAAAQAQVAVASGEEGKRAAAEKITKTIAKSVPGWLPGRRGARSSAQLGIAGRFLGR